MSNFTQAPIVTAKQMFSSSAVQEHQLGSFARTRDGRGFRYARAGASNLVVGNLLQSSAQIANHQNLTPTADVAAGATVFSVTLGATAAALDLYAEGFAVVDTTPGLGYPYAISGHAAVLSAGVLTAQLFADDPIQVALTAAASRITLQANPYKHVIQTPAALTGGVAGVAVYPIVANEYGWVQTHGPSAALVAGTPAVGNTITASATPGAVAIHSTTLPILGYMLVTGVAARVQPVFLTID